MLELDTRMGSKVLKVLLEAVPITNIRCLGILRALPLRCAAVEPAANRGPHVRFDDKPSHFIYGGEYLPTYRMGGESERKPLAGGCVRECSVPAAIYWPLRVHMIMCVCVQSASWHLSVSTLHIRVHLA